MAWESACRAAGGGENKREGGLGERDWEALSEKLQGKESYNDAVEGENCGSDGGRGQIKRNFIFRTSQDDVGKLFTLRQFIYRWVALPVIVWYWGSKRNLLMYHFAMCELNFMLTSQKNVYSATHLKIWMQLYQLLVELRDVWVVF